MTITTNPNFPQRGVKTDPLYPNLHPSFYGENEPRRTKFPKSFLFPAETICASNASKIDIMEMLPTMTKMDLVLLGLRLCSSDFMKTDSVASVSTHSF